MEEIQVTNWFNWWNEMKKEGGGRVQQEKNRGRIEKQTE